MHAAAGMLLKRRLASRLGAIRQQLAGFGSKEEIAAAIKAGSGDDEKKSASHQSDFAGAPAQPALPQFPEAAHPHPEQKQS